MKSRTLIALVATLTICLGIFVLLHGGIAGILAYITAIILIFIFA